MPLPATTAGREARTRENGGREFPCSSPRPTYDFVMPIKKGRGRRGVGQSYKAAPRDLATPALPPASDVVVKRLDGGVVRIEPALERMPADIARRDSSTAHKGERSLEAQTRLTKQRPKDESPKPPRRAREGRAQKARTTSEGVGDASLDASRLYVLNTDGASVPNPGPSGIGAVLRGPTGEIVDQLSRPIGIATNNEAEYRALIEGIRLATARGAPQLLIRMDSQLVVQQVLGRWAVKKTELRPLRREARELLDAFEAWKLVHVLRNENAEADQLADAALGLDADSDRVLVVQVARFTRRCPTCREATRQGEQIYLAQLGGKKKWVCGACAAKVSLQSTTA